MVKEGTKCGANKVSVNNKSHTKKSKKIKQKKENTTLQSSTIGSISECNLTCKISCTNALKAVALQIYITTKYISPPKSEQIPKSEQNFGYNTPPVAF